MNCEWMSWFELDAEIAREADRVVADFGEDEALTEACLLIRHRLLPRESRAFHIDVALRLSRSPGDRSLCGKAV